MAASLEEHDVFFGRIIGMIPRELYKPVEPEEEFESKYFKHKKVPLPQDVKKTISKRKKEEKYGMGEVSSTNGNDDEMEDMDEEDGDGGQAIGDEDDKEVDSSSKKHEQGSFDEEDKYGTLRERLKAKLDDMRAARTSKKRSIITAGGARPLKKLKGDVDQASKGNKKKGTKLPANGTTPGGSPDGDSGVTTNSSQSFTKESNNSNLVESLSTGADLDFSSLKSGAKASFVKTPKGKPGTKKQRLERMLETAEKKRERLQELRNSGEAGKERAKSEQWNDIISAASGKEGIDVNRVKKALKRREQTKVKSAKEWNKRTKAVESHEKDKIASREANITARKESKLGMPPPAEDKDKESSNKKKEGRNKTAALSNRKRAGFEGKTNAGFLNKSSTNSNKKQEKR